MQPDLVFVAEDWVHIIRDRIWGAPDLVVEVESLGSRFYDRRDKNGWEPRVRRPEQWVVSPVEKAIEIYDLTKPAGRPARFTSKKSCGQLCYRAYGCGLVGFLPIELLFSLGELFSSV